MNNKILDWKCSFCGQEFKDFKFSSIGSHVRWCRENPNRVQRKSRRLAEKDRMPKEVKSKIISEGRKKYLKANPDKHPWKNNDKFKSVPCEKLRQTLRDNGFIFSEEYEPLEDRLFSIDIAFVENRVALEVNGNQHYDKDGALLPYYQDRHDLIEKAGWKVYEIHFLKVYDVEYVNEVMTCLRAGLTLPEHKVYIKEKSYTVHNKRTKKSVRYKSREEYLEIRESLSDKIKNGRVNIVLSSGIDYSKFGWATQLSKLLGMKSQSCSRWLRENMPEFHAENCHKYGENGYSKKM